MSGKVIKTLEKIHGYLPLDHNKKYTIDNTDNVRGIYSISYDLDNEKNKDSMVLTKIGAGGVSEKSESSGLLRRLYSYGTCYPDSTWNYAFLICPSVSLTKKCEKEIHTYLDKKGLRYKSEWRNRDRPQEWFYCSIGQIQEAFLNSGLNHPSCLVVFPVSDEKESKIIDSKLKKTNRKLNK